MDLLEANIDENAPSSAMLADGDPAEPVMSRAQNSVSILSVVIAVQKSVDSVPRTALEPAATSELPATANAVTLTTEDMDLTASYYIHILGIDPYKKYGKYLYSEGSIG